ncbi:hypothetical protein ACP4OV_021795 [Aristida adscensionis]
MMELLKTNLEKREVQIALSKPRGKVMRKLTNRRCSS